MTERLDAPPLPRVSSFDLLALDWEAPARRSRAAARRPERATAALSGFHGSRPVRAAVVGDLALVFTAVAVVGGRAFWESIAFTVAVVIAGVASHVYVDRDSVQTRGVSWYPRTLLLPLSVVGLAFGLGHVMSVQAATLSTAGALAALVAGRVLSGLGLAVARRRGLGLRSTLVIGADDLTLAVCQRLAEFPEAGLEPVRRLDYATAATAEAVDREVQRRGIEHIVLVAPTATDGHIAIALIDEGSNTAPYISVVPALAELYVNPRGTGEVGGIPFVPLGRPSLRRERFPGKRALDLVGGGLLLLLLLPLLAAVAVAIRLDDGGPVLFRQRRVGRGNRPFEIFKFRTMVVGAELMQESLAAANVTDGLLFKLRSDPRVTRVGRVLRRTSLDELPQLWNVLRGDMSLVGPRPLAAEPHAFSAQERERHSVRPGMTGYWQLSGGNELSYAEMVRLDLAYIRHWSIWLDLRIALRTVPALVHRHGAV